MKRLIITPTFPYPLSEKRAEAALYAASTNYKTRSDWQPVPIVSQEARTAGFSSGEGGQWMRSINLHLTCTLRIPDTYTMNVRCIIPPALDAEVLQEPVEQQWEWEGMWGEAHMLELQ